MEKKKRAEGEGGKDTEQRDWEKRSRYREHGEELRRLEKHSDRREEEGKG